MVRLDRGLGLASTTGSGYLALFATSGTTSTASGLGTATTSSAKGLEMACFAALGALFASVQTLIKGVLGSSSVVAPVRGHGLSRVGFVLPFLGLILLVIGCLTIV